MLKKTFEKHMTESSYMGTILNKMSGGTTSDDTDENCSICLDTIDNPTLTSCGHLFCYECVKLCLGNQKKCPICKTDISGKELMVVNKTVKINKIDENPLITKYGSKLGKLISIIRFLVAHEDTRIIIFSQWDDMLSLVGKTLAENGIENCFVKGNVYSRNSAISKFRLGKNNSGCDNKVIMLSLKNSASGTNLTEATHIFFVEPINAQRTESNVIESQAIARACRVGQKQKILLMRILVENTIEENIYKKYYNANVVIPVDTVTDKHYLLESQNVKKPILIKEQDTKILKKIVKRKTKEIEI